MTCSHSINNTKLNNVNTINQRLYNNCWYFILYYVKYCYTSVLSINSKLKLFILKQNNNNNNNNNGTYINICIKEIWLLKVNNNLAVTIPPVMKKEIFVLYFAHGQCQRPGISVSSGRCVSLPFPDRTSHQLSHGNGTFS